MKTQVAIIGAGPSGLLLGQLLVGVSAGYLSLAHMILWWVHFFLAMGFIAAIPFTKLRHIFTTSANCLPASVRFR